MRIHQAQDVLPCSKTLCPCIQAPGKGNKWLGCDQLVMLLGRAQPLVWVLDCGGWEGIKKLLSKASESFPWKSMQVLRVGPCLNGFVGWHPVHMMLQDSSITLMFQRAP